MGRSSASSPGDARLGPRTQRRRIPVGVEKLLYLAAGDPAFAAQLAADRPAAVRASGVVLTPTETALLATIPDPALTRMIAGISPADHERRSFMSKVAGAVALLSAGGACEGGEGCDAEVRDAIAADGSRPYEAGPWDAGPEAGLDAEADASLDAQTDASLDAQTDATLDAQTDATLDASLSPDGALDAEAPDAALPDGDVPDAQ